MATRLSSRVPPLPNVGYDAATLLQHLAENMNHPRPQAKLALHHSAIPDALDKHCASPAKVKDTTLGSLYDFQPTKLTGLSTPSGNFLSVRAINEPPCVLSLTAFAEAASDQEQTVRSRGSM